VQKGKAGLLQTRMRCNMSMTCNVLQQCSRDFDYCCIILYYFISVDLLHLILLLLDAFS
jgi:hypothetical protein